jgi:hypothetical protein
MNETWTYYEQSCQLIRVLHTVEKYREAAVKDFNQLSSPRSDLTAPQVLEEVKRYQGFIAKWTPAYDKVMQLKAFL